MSWRFLSIFLLLAAGAAAFGGVQLGDWLVSHAPVAAPPPNPMGDDPDVDVLDADGKPYMAQPPQPLVNGRLGVPEQPVRTEWDITGESLLFTNKNPRVHVASSRLSADQIRTVEQVSAGRPPGPADVVAVDMPAPGQGSRAVQPDAPPMQPLQLPGAPAGNWQDTLRSELAQCAQLGFFDRPSCAWGARNRHCAPNKAWGTIRECPRRPD